MQTQKTEAIKKTLAQTKERRKGQICKVYELKVDKSRFSQTTRQSLHLLFLEAKWLRNAIVGCDDLFSFNTKVKQVQVKVADTFETRPLRVLGSQLKQSIHEQLKAEVKGLATKKKQGQRVGKLRFKSRVTSVNLKQHGVTYRLTPNGRLSLQKLKQRLRVRGMDQIPEGAEFANAKLIHRHGDFFLHVTCFITQAQLDAYKEKKKAQTPKPEKMMGMGLDMGIAHQIATDDGLKIAYRIPVSDTIRKRHRQLSRTKKGSKNRAKARERLEKAYAKTTNIKQDIIHKLIAVFFLFAQKVCVQEDCVKGWQRIWGRRILETSIGGLLGKLKKLPDAVLVHRFFPSSQLCYQCKHRTKHELSERIFVCSVCGHTDDRDVNAAKNTLLEGLCQIGAVRSESPLTPPELEGTPVDISTSALIYGYLAGIPYVSVSRVDETGSPSL